MTKIYQVEYLDEATGENAGYSYHAAKDEADAHQRRTNKAHAKGKDADMETIVGGVREIGVPMPITKRSLLNLLNNLAAHPSFDQ